MVRGQIVISTAGHDKGEMLVIAGFDKNRVLVCDGKQRKLERLKPKNPKHIKETEILLNEDSIATNRKIRKTLNKTANPGG
jgi:ribosomal protein L14E/L6E/L27E